MSEPDGNHSEAANARPRTAAQLQRQFEVFNRHVVDGETYREIATALRMSAKTIAEDLRCEGERRADEIADRRGAEQARAVAVYQEVIRRSFKLAARADETVPFYGGDGQVAGVSSPFASLARGLDSVTKARERIDKILGIDAPTKVDLGVQTLLDALAIPPEG